MAEDPAAPSLDLPKLAPATARATGALLGICRALEVPVLGEQARLRFHLVDAASAGDLLEVGTPSGDVHVSLAPLLAMAERSELSGFELNRLPGDLLPAVLATVLEQELDQLEDLLGRGCEPTGVVTAPPAGSEPVGITVDLDGQVYAGAIWAPLDILAKISDRVSVAPPEALRRHDLLPVRLGVEIGMTVVSADELAATRTGDLLLIDVAAPIDQPVGLLRVSSSKAFRVSIEQDQIEVIDLVDSSTTAAVPGGGSKVRLTFERGSVELPAGDLARIASGTKLPLHDAETCVVKAGSAPFRQGGLVSVLGKPAVRIDG